MIYVRVHPSCLTAEHLNRITIDHGCELPTASTIRIKDLDTLELLRDDLIVDGVTLELVDEADATPARLTDKEVRTIASGWLCRELREQARYRGG